MRTEIPIYNRKMKSDDRSRFSELLDENLSYGTSDNKGGMCTTVQSLVGDWRTQSALFIGLNGKSNKLRNTFRYIREFSLH